MFEIKIKVIVIEIPLRKKVERTSMIKTDNFKDIIGCRKLVYLEYLDI